MTDPGPVGEGTTEPGAGLRPLDDGEPIGVVALSGPVRRDLLAAGLRELASWGHPVVVAANLSDRHLGYLAGDDDARLAGLEQVLDEGARVVLAARGGYGATRLLPRLPWRRLREEAVTLVGYSDLTAVLNPLAAASGTVQVHGPMAAAGLVRRDNARRLRALLSGELDEPLLTFGQRQVVRPGVREGHLVGGNLSVLVSLLGTEWEPRFDGAVLLLEDVNEPQYRLDRMLTQLRTSGRLDRVAAILGGRLSRCWPAAGLRDRWRDLLAEAAPDDAVVVDNLPFGHVTRNLALPIGARVRVDSERATVTVLSGADSAQNSSLAPRK